MMLQMACSNTLIQTMVPDQLRGRVMSVYSMMFMGMAPFGAFFGGALAAPHRRAHHGRRWEEWPASSAPSGSDARCPNCASKPAA